MALHNVNYLATWYLNEGVVTGRLPRPATGAALLRRDAHVVLFGRRDAG